MFFCMQMPSHPEMTRTTQMALKILSVRTVTTRVSSRPPLKVSKSPGCHLSSCQLFGAFPYPVALLSTLSLLSQLWNWWINQCCCASFSTACLFLCHSVQTNYYFSLLGFPFSLWFFSVWRLTLVGPCAILVFFLATHCAWFNPVVPDGGWLPTSVPLAHLTMTGRHIWEGYQWSLTGTAQECCW